MNKISEKTPFEIKDFKGDPEISRHESLKFIIRSLYQTWNKPEVPRHCREKITKNLLDHGQFEQNEIDVVFEGYGYESDDYSDEFYEDHPEIDKREEIKNVFTGKKSVLTEKKYNFPSFSCDYKIYAGFCTVNPEPEKCPDCGLEVLNAPDNVTWGYEKDLVCPVCFGKRDDEFDTIGLIKDGNPTHHGRWDTQKPEFEFGDTDYFSFLHPKCKKSELPDGKGIMHVNGLWVDSCGRIVLGLKCIYCGAKNALKPFTTEKEIPLLNESGSKWKSFKSPVMELIDNVENKEVEFKSCLISDSTDPNKKKDYEFIIAKSVAAFMNSGEGYLLFGIDKYRNIVGIEKDYPKLGKGKEDQDGFQLRFSDIIKKYIEKSFFNYINVEFDHLQDHDVCCVRVNKSDIPCYTKEGQFFIRASGFTQQLSAKETVDYLQANFNEQR